MIEIRKATLKDVELISEIAGKTFIESHGHSASELNISNYVKHNYNVDTFIKELQNSENNYYLVYYNKVLAGFSNIQFNKIYPKIENKAVAKLDRIYILKSFYGLTIGKVLFDFNEKLAIENHQFGIWLYVWTENERSIQFYSKNNFKIKDNTFFEISKTHSNPNYIMYKEF